MATVVEEEWLVECPNFVLRGVLLSEETEKHLPCRPITILCHGLFSSSESLGTVAHSLLQGFASSAIQSSGLSLLDKMCVLSVDFRGCGKSSGQWSLGGYEEESEDLRCFVNEARSRGYVVHCLAGHSRGANTVLLYGAKFNDVPKIVSIAGRFDLTQGAERHFSLEQLKCLDSEGSGEFEMDCPDGKRRKIYRECIRRRKELDMTKTVQGIKSPSLLFIHGKADHCVPVEDAIAFQEVADAAAGRKSSEATLFIINGAGHNIWRRSKYLHRLVDKIVEFACTSGIDTSESTPQLLG